MRLGGDYESFGDIAVVENHCGARFFFGGGGTPQKTSVGKWPRSLMLTETVRGFIGRSSQPTAFQNPPGGNLLIWLIFTFQIFMILKNLFVMLTNRLRARKVIRHVHKTHIREGLRWDANLRTRAHAVGTHVRLHFRAALRQNRPNAVDFTQMHWFS